MGIFRIVDLTSVPVIRVKLNNKTMLPTEAMMRKIRRLFLSKPTMVIRCDAMRRPEEKGD